MSLSTILDVGVGLIFTFLVMSLIVSSLQEIAASMFRMRAKQLERALTTILAGQKVSGDQDEGPELLPALLKHPLIRTLGRPGRPFPRLLRPFPAPCPTPG